tara:strand:- start:1475 stop:1894 length:420 start_codon:yes stop_codon:yes gene_type:complete
MDTEQLLKALNNEKNEMMLEHTFSKIKNRKNDILQKLQLTKGILKELHKKLKNYKYCETVEEMDYGHYVRWISLKNPEVIKLTNGGIICNIKIQNDIPYLLCKNNINRMFQVNLNECIIFQKLTDNELIILEVMKYLEQ